MKLIKIITAALVCVAMFTVNVDAQKISLLDRMERVDDLKSQLNLTSDQVFKIKETIKNNLTAEDFNRAKLKQLHAEFKAAKNVSNPDVNKINRLIDEIAQTRAAHTKKRFATQTKIKSHLNAAQRNKLNEIIKDRRANKH